MSLISILKLLCFNFLLIFINPIYKDKTYHRKMGNKCCSATAKKKVANFKTEDTYDANNLMT
jgi:hypothetical protein